MLDFWGAPYELRLLIFRIASIGSVVRERDDSCGFFLKTEVGPVDDYSTLQTPDLPKYPAVWGGGGSGSGFRWWSESVGEVNWVFAS